MFCIVAFCMEMLFRFGHGYFAAKIFPNNFIYMWNNTLATKIIAAYRVKNEKFKCQWWHTISIFIWCSKVANDASSWWQATERKLYLYTNDGKKIKSFALSSIGCSCHLNNSVLLILIHLVKKNTLEHMLILWYIFWNIDVFLNIEMNAHTHTDSLLRKIRWIRYISTKRFVCLHYLFHFNILLRYFSRQIPE